MKEKKVNLSPTAEKNSFIISHEFNVSKPFLFKVWSEEKHLKNWWGPKGSEVYIVRLEFRPGGIMHYRLQYPQGAVIWGKFVYREIEAPERIVFINSFANEKGEVVRAPFNMNWPLETLTTIHFKEQNHKTIVTVKWTPYAASEEEQKTFDAHHSSMQQGWSSTFDQLASYLTKF